MNRVSCDQAATKSTMPKVHSFIFHLQNCRVQLGPSVPACHVWLWRFRSSTQSSNFSFAFSPLPLSLWQRSHQSLRPTSLSRRASQKYLLLLTPLSLDAVDVVRMSTPMFSSSMEATGTLVIVWPLRISLTYVLFLPDGVV